MSTAPTSEPDPAEHPTEPSRPTGTPRPSAALIFDDPLDQHSSDDTDDGWGERPAASGGSAADLARFLDEKPPHHI
ncbi:hypothetical protein AB0O07_21985 [Streptomyces sp. NPDC093085]|uniref:hypothetical protein n=1 Tax=Streptomyces sp. NPDC093085 TaxID=3155068 RepID=UPI00343AC098